MSVTNSPKKWQVLDPAPEDFFLKFKNSGHPEVVLSLLYQRGLKDEEEIRKFFHPSYEDLSNSLLMLGIKKAAERIQEAVERKEKIILYHDYDADGVCGAVVLASVLKELKADFITYTPDRQKEGYGLNEGAVKEILKDKIDLLIAIDCGITNVKEVDLLNESNTDVIIVDHHLQANVLPRAYAIVNPKQKECGYEFKNLCAAGVAFKLACAILADYNGKIDIKKGAEKWLLDVVAVATIADMMPLLGENRTLVKYGLIVAGKTKRKGLKKLLNDSKDNVTSGKIAFQVAPRINATSRMTHASVSFNLLMSEDENEVEELMRAVEETNNARRKVVDEAVKNAIFWIDSDIEKSGDAPSIIFIGNDSWSPGVVGLIAGKLSEKYNRSSFVYGKVGDIFKGSCRGAGNFNVVEAMAKCAEQDAEMFKAFGGHAQAGGFSVYTDKILSFKKELLRIAEGYKGVEEDPSLKIDAEIAPSAINRELADILLSFEPFGQANEPPVFLARSLEVASARVIGNGEKHLKMKLKSIFENGKVAFFDAVGFGMAGFYNIISEGDRIDVVFNLDINEWNGRKELQLKLKDIKITKCKNQKSK